MSDSPLYTLQYPELSFAKINAGILKKARVVQLILRNQIQVVKLFLDITLSQEIYTELTSITLFSDFSKVLIWLTLLVTITRIKIEYLVTEPKSTQVFTILINLNTLW